MKLQTRNKIMGWEVPEGTIPCWPVNDIDRIKSLKNKEPFYNFNPSCYFKILKRINNQFYEGYLGHVELQGNFHKEFNTRQDCFIDYQKRQHVYFTFDRISLYSLVEIIPDVNLIFVFRRVDDDKLINFNTAFMIMPFKDDVLNNFYQSNIKSFLKTEFGIDIKRSDDFNGNDFIVETISTNRSSRIYYCRYNSLQ